MMVGGVAAGGQGRGDYLVPQNLDAEISVLGASMLTPNVIPAVSEIIRPHHFYRQAHQRIYEAIEDLFARGEPIDPITVCEQLANRAALEAVGGRAFVHSLMTAVPAATNARQYAEIVRENYYLRSLIKVGGEITEMAYRREHPPMDLIDRAEQMVFDISQTRVVGEFSPISELIDESWPELERTMTEGHQTVGCATGFRDLDYIIGGFRPSNLVILAARPSMGKTALALNIARNVAVDQGKGVALFSLEMSKMEVVNRMMCSEARVDHWRVQRGMLRPDEWSKLAAACTPLHTAPIFVDDSASLNLMEIRAKARRLRAREKNLGLIILDYLQLMMVTWAPRTASRRCPASPGGLRSSPGNWRCRCWLFRSSRGRWNSGPATGRSCLTSANRAASSRMLMWCCSSTVTRCTTGKVLTRARPRSLWANSGTGPSANASWPLCRTIRVSPIWPIKA